MTSSGNESPVIGLSEPWPVHDAQAILTDICRSLGLLPGTPGQSVHQAVLTLIEQCEPPHPTAPAPPSPPIPPPEAQTNTRRDEGVLSVYEAADLLRLSALHVRRLAESGELPGAKLGDRWRFSRRAPLRHLDPHRP